MNDVLLDEPRNLSYVTTRNFFETESSINVFDISNVFNILTPISNLTLSGIITNLNFCGGPDQLIASFSSNPSRIELINSSNPTNLTNIRVIITPGFASEAVCNPSGSVAFVADDSALISINVTTGVMLGNQSLTSGAQIVTHFHNSDTIAVAGNGVINLLNTTDPNSLSVISGVDFDNTQITSIEVAADDSVLFLGQISDPTIYIFNTSSLDLTPFFGFAFSTSVTGINTIDFGPNRNLFVGGDFGWQKLMLDENNIPQLISSYQPGIFSNEGIDYIMKLVVTNTGITHAVGFTNYLIIGSNIVPRITTNNFIINQNEETIINTDNVAIADPDDSDPNNLFVVVSNLLEGGSFIDSNGLNITYFSLQQLANNEIRFIPDKTTTSLRFDLRAVDRFSATMPVPANVIPTSVSISDNIGAIVGATLAGITVCCYYLFLLVASFGYQKYRRNQQANNELELEDNYIYHDLDYDEPSARKVAKRYQILDQSIPEHLQIEYIQRTGFTEISNPKPLGEGQSGQTWVAYDEKAPPKSQYQYLAAKLVSSEVHFKDQLGEAEIQRKINGTNLSFIQQINANHILNDKSLSATQKQQQLNISHNCFYLVLTKKDHYNLVYLHVNDNLQIIDIHTNNKLTALKKALQKITRAGLEAIFANKPCSYQLIEANSIDDWKKIIQKQSKDLEPLIYYVIHDDQNWQVYYKHPNGKLEQANLQDEKELTKALNEVDKTNLQQLFQEFHEKQYYYEKNRLLRLITNHIPYDEFINLSHHVMPVFDSFAQKKVLYILSSLAPKNGEYIKAQLVNPKLDSEIKSLLLLLIAKDLTDAVKYLQSKDLVHNDLKPDNLVFDQYGNLLLIDYGLARECPKNLPSLSVLKKDYLIGNIPLAAPEVFPNNRKYNQLLNNKIDKSSEIKDYFFAKDNWSLGATLLAFYLGCSNPFATEPELSNPKDQIEWGFASEQLMRQGTFEYFESKVSVFNDSQSPFIQLLKNLLVVRLDQPNARNLDQAANIFEQNAGDALKKALSRRTELFSGLEEISSLRSAPSTKQSNTYLNENSESFFTTKKIIISEQTPKSNQSKQVTGNYY